MSRTSRRVEADSLFLTDEGFWDDYWDRVRLPAEITRSTSLYTDAILDVFDRHLAAGKGRSALEIGGAPGQYLAYLHKNLGYSVYALDNSEIGCEKTKENFRLLGVPGAVIHGDLFSESLDLPSFDVAYSLGLIEHATSAAALIEVVRAHVRLVKPGGLVLLGCPNLRGVYRLLLQRLSPPFLRMHNLDVMDVRNWRGFEDELGLRTVWKGYVGGFEPSLLARHAGSRGAARVVGGAFRALGRLLDRRALRLLRQANSPLWSGYVIGIYRSPVATRRT